MPTSVQKITNAFVHHWQIITIAFAGLLVRLYQLTSISLWHDEAFSALLIKYSWSEMIYRIGLDVHPPMYYIFLRIWHYVFGNSLFSLRGMSVFFGVATIIAAYFFVKHVFNNAQAAVIAALLVAFNPFLVQYVTEARMYTMGSFFAIVAAYYLAIALRNQKQVYTEHAHLNWKLQRLYVRPYIIFAVASAILILTHYYLLFTVAALALYAIWYHLKSYGFTFKYYGWLIASGALIALSFLPWLKIFLFQYKQVGNGYWIPPMDSWSIPNTLFEMIVKIGNPSKYELLLVTLATVWIISRVIKKYSNNEKWLLISLFIAPFAGAILFYVLAQLNDQSSSVYLVRYFIFTSAFYAIIIALYLHTFTTKHIRNVLVIVLCGMHLYAIGYYWNQIDVATKPGMAALSAFTNANVEPNHKLYVGSSFQFFNFKYYNKSGVTPLLFSGGQSDTSNMPHFAGTAILTNEDLVPDFNKATISGDTVWVIWTNGFGGAQPLVPDNWTRIDEKRFAEVRPYVGTFVTVTQYKVN
ncbi:MAG: glycosyltransferase family 39 protein [bacterium]|nr:glycosyltransferase family 39 protein [bacterium]